MTLQEKIAQMTKDLEAARKEYVSMKQAQENARAQYDQIAVKANLFHRNEIARRADLLESLNLARRILETP
jgi:hypothetical protein